MDGFKRPKRPLPQGSGSVQPGVPRPGTPYEQRIASQAPPRPQSVVPGATSATPLQQTEQYSAPQQHVTQPQSGVLEAQLPEIAISAPELPSQPKKRHVVRMVLLILLALLVLVGGAAYWWYQDSLKPLDANDATGKDVGVEKGETLGSIAADLQQKGLIKSQYAFQIYARLSGQTNVAEGNCVIKASENASQIIAKLTKGCNDFKSIMFYPGATIEKPLYRPAGATGDLDTMYIKFRLQKAGYTDAQIEVALDKQYTGPLFADKPADTSLEGYIYGETYHVDVTANVEQILQTTFDQMYKDLTANDLIAKFKAQGLNLYQGITMASIVQRELNCEGKPTVERKERCYQYQRTIAQVFLKRLNEGDMLGSDVTFIYAADMKGVSPTVDIDSPYNTRINRGLPPGPIASPGLLAMKAVGNPSDTDYNFFIAGDDGLIYFARTLQEHEANIAQHCQIGCNDL